MGLIIITIIDVIGLFISFQLSYFVRAEIFPYFYVLKEPLPLTIFNPLWFPVVLIFFFWYESLYDKRYPLWEEVRQIWKASFLTSLTTLAIVSLGKLTESISRTVLLLTFLNSLWILPITRLYVKRFLLHTGIWRKKIVVIGAGKTAELFSKAMSKEKNMGYQIAGYLDDDKKKKDKTINGVRVLGELSDLDRIIKFTSIKDVVIAIPSLKSEKLVKLINEIQKKVKKVSFIPDLFGIPFLQSDMDFFFENHLLMLNVRNSLKNPFNKAVKSVFDLVVSIPMVIISLFVILVCAVLIKLDSKGPVFIIQNRIGKNGKNFRCIKFRGMYVNADEILEKTLKKDRNKKKEWETYHKLKNDPRVTKFGKILRKSSLDELPQIFNVIKGEMSLVGPRPYLPREKNKIGDFHSIITEVTPGVTGLWQVSGRSKTSFMERLVIDSWYVQNWSLWLDIMVIIKTIKVVFKREGAY
ncbi:MAG: undecaprenyl-phosphate galactose phosphotransferase WbaP [Candidatus Firestonebacteria bacterium]